MSARAVSGMTPFQSRKWPLGIPRVSVALAAPTQPRSGRALAGTLLRVSAASIRGFPAVAESPRPAPRQ